MKYPFFLALLTIILWSCSSDNITEKGPTYLGKVKQVSVNSFKMSPQKQEVTDSLSSWIPLEEYSRTFNENGQLIKETIGALYSTEAQDTLSYQYDAEGKLLEKKYRSPQSAKNRITKYMYNVDDQLNAINVMLPDNNLLDTVILYNYDSEGTLRSINEFHNKEDYDEFVATLVRKYFNTVKNMLRTDYYRKNPYTGKHYYAKKITEKFRSNGQLFEEKIESGGTTIHKYEYNKANLLTAILTYDDLNQLIEKTAFEYDSYGNIVLKTFQSDVGSYSYRCEYTYDDQQNWTEKRIFIADGETPAYVVERSFSYF
jgi:hypothetical protein